MFKKIYTSILISLFSLTLSFGCAYAAKTQESKVPVKEAYTDCLKTPDAEFAKSLDVVANPEKYLNKKIYMNVTFDKFSILGLDYQPALRENANYIGFLIQRDDVVDHNVPLSEMKLFLKRDYAEKFIDLETGDKIQIAGTVFSMALGDPWIDIEEITITQKAKVQEETKENTKK